MPAAVAARSGALPYVGNQQQLAGPPPEGFAADSGGLLFKKVTPRRRQDQFGRDNTRHADYLLSMAVFPTGVRAPLLSELQKKTEHQCGFEVIEKASERAAGGGRHVHICDSKAESYGSRHGSAADSAKKPPPNTPLTASIKLSYSPSADRATRHSQSISVPPSSRGSTSPDKHRWVRSSAEGSRANNLGGGEKKMKDIRDPLYLNTYCPEERKLRYKKSSLPRLSNRTRPWTVSEPNPSYRFARNSQEEASEKLKTRQGKTAWSHGANFRIDARDVVARVKGRVSAYQNGIGEEGSEDDGENSAVDSQQALLEVKSYFPVADIVLGDQRDSLRGKDGCLHAKVKQCIKFVKYREKLARSTSMERPLKSENGRYRPFSTTTIRTPRAPSSTSPVPRHPDPTSVEIYKEYIDTIALQTRLVSAADKRRKPRPAMSGAPRYNTAASSYQDSVLQSVSESNRPTPTDGSVVDKASKPSESTSFICHPPNSSSATDRDQDSVRDQNGGSDPRGVHHALDIIRLSPKAQPPRSSRTSRGGRSQRDEGEEVKIEEEESEGKAKTHAIFLPNVTKSATTSVCSFVDESITVAET